MKFDTIMTARTGLESDGPFAPNGAPAVSSSAGRPPSPRVILTEASPVEHIERLAGNKGRSLHRLASLGVPVPHWAILGTDCFADFRREGGLGQKIAALLSSFTPANAAVIASTIREAVLTCDMSPAARRCTNRSSATDIGSLVSSKKRIAPRVSIS